MTFCFPLGVYMIREDEWSSSSSFWPDSFVSMFSSIRKSLPVAADGISWLLMSCTADEPWWLVDLSNPLLLLLFKIGPLVC